MAAGYHFIGRHLHQSFDASIDEKNLFHSSFICFHSSKMSSATLFRPDQRVTIAGKGIGTIAFVGKTEFADGK